MKIATGTGDFKNYCATDEERIRELYKAGFQYIDLNDKGYFTLECDSTLRQPKSWLGDRRRFAKDERAIKPPFFMQRDLEKLLYKKAKYLLEEYHLFEE